MFAVIKTGGKQYRVAANDLLKIEKVEAKSAISSKSATCSRMAKARMSPSARRSSMARW